MSSDYYSPLTGSSSMASTNAATSTNCNSNNNNNNNNACTSTRWLTEEVFALIDLVQRNEAIYNPRHKYYFCRPYVENFWREVDLKLEKNPGASLAKWTNLRISFRREYTNYLEEKVPPCWTYFDRMFFLHPYLRKKHQQSKSLDSQVQDALAHISSLTNRLQRKGVMPSGSINSLGHGNNSLSPSQPQLDNYLEYFDDPEPNPSELDDMIDDEPPNPSQFAHSTLASDIKSECEDNVDEYDSVERAVDDDDHEADDVDMRSYMFNSMEKRHQQQHHQRLQHLQRLQSRAFYEEFRNKRSRSHENISSSQSYTAPPINPPTSSNHSSNVSFVKPKFAKPLEAVSTTTQGNGNGSSNTNNSSSSSSTLSNASLPNDSEAVSNSTTPRLASSSSHHHPHQNFVNNNNLSHPNQRFEISSLNGQNSLPTISNNLGQQHHSSTSTPGATAALAGIPSAAVTPELCDCKTDPDAMFLMSLLPDIQKLNGRDRGKIKIAFQNILQDYLYPD